MKPATTSIRPALETLRELDDRMFLDRLALQIHDATDAVRAMGRPAKLTITLDIKPLKNQRVVEPIITITAEIAAKLPQPEPMESIFYIDENGNPTKHQPKEKQPSLGIAIGEGSA